MRLIAVDRLGFGESDDAPEMYGYEEVTADLEEFIVGIKLEELVVMAHCLGGAIALNLTASSTVGKRVKALGLLASNTDPFHSSATTEFRESVGVPEAEDEEAQKTYEKQVCYKLAPMYVHCAQDFYQLVKIIIKARPCTRVRYCL